MEEYYALFVGKLSEYNRDFGNGNRVELKRGVARPVSKEVALILKDVKNIAVFTDVDDKPISFREKMLREEWKDLVHKHGIKKAKKVREEQDERIRQAVSKTASKRE